MRLVYEPNDVLVEWARAQMPPYSRGFGPARAIGVADGDALLACALFFNCRTLNGEPFDIEIGFSAVSPRWATRGMIRGILKYPFVQLGCARLTTVTAKANKRARKLDEGLGFKLEGVHPHGLAPGVTAISYGMLREDCKWLAS